MVAAGNLTKEKQFVQAYSSLFHSMAYIESQIVCLARDIKDCSSREAETISWNGPMKEVTQVKRFLVAVFVYKKWNRPLLFFPLYSDNYQLVMLSEIGRDDSSHRRGPYNWGEKGTE